jgi:hypothetical protein
MVLLQSYRWKSTWNSVFLQKFVSSLLIVLPSILLFHVPAALARQWVMIGNNPDIFVDVDSIKGQGDSRTFWSRIVYDEEQYLQGYRFLFSTSLLYVN